MVSVSEGSLIVSWWSLSPGSDGHQDQQRGLALQSHVGPARPQPIRAGPRLLPALPASQPQPADRHQGPDGGGELGQPSGPGPQPGEGEEEKRDEGRGRRAWSLFITADTRTRRLV